MRAIVLLAALVLGGCANFEYANEQYGTTPHQMFEFNGSTYRVFDKTQASKLMITPTLGAAAGDGFVRGLTFGLYNPHPSEPVYHEAVGAYLASTGRTCTTDTGQLIVQPQWEFRYACAATSARNGAIGTAAAAAATAR
jgi:hypothetical protein